MVQEAPEQAQAEQIAPMVEIQFSWQIRQGLRLVEWLQLAVVMAAMATTELSHPIQVEVAGVVEPLELRWVPLER